MDNDVIKVDGSARDPSQYGGHDFLETTRGRAESKRHPCVTKNANVRNECSKISALWVEGNLEIALTEVKFGKKF